MAKLILLGMIILSVAMPMALAERSAPKKSLRLIWTVTLAAALVWAILCTQVYPLLVFPQ